MKEKNRVKREKFVKGVTMAWKLELMTRAMNAAGIPIPEFVPPKPGEFESRGERSKGDPIKIAARRHKGLEWAARLGRSFSPKEWTAHLVVGDSAGSQKCDCEYLVLNGGWLIKGPDGRFVATPKLLAVSFNEIRMLKVNKENIVTPLESMEVAA